MNPPLAFYCSSLLVSVLSTLPNPVIKAFLFFNPWHLSEDLRRDMHGYLWSHVMFMGILRSMDSMPLQKLMALCADSSSVVMKKD